MTLLAAAALAFTVGDTVTFSTMHGMRCCCPCTYYTVRVTAAGFDTLSRVDLYYEEAFQYQPKYPMRDAPVDRAAGSGASLAVPEQAATAAPVSFTLPTMQRQGCGPGPSRIVADSVDYTVYARVQSPAWIAMSPAMLASPEVYAAIWPVCRSEAEPFVVARGRGVPGGRVYIPSPPALPIPHWFSVTSTNAAGESCQSNVVEGKQPARATARNGR